MAWEGGAAEVAAAALEEAAAALQVAARAVAVELHRGEGRVVAQAPPPGAPQVAALRLVGRVAPAVAPAATLAALLPAVLLCRLWTAQRRRRWSLSSR